MKRAGGFAAPLLLDPIETWIITSMQLHNPGLTEFKET